MRQPRQPQGSSSSSSSSNNSSSSDNSSSPPETMDHDHDLCGQPAGDGPRQDFFGGIHRCRERAADIYAGPGRERSCLKVERFRRKWWGANAYAGKQVEQARRQERRVESMLTSNLRYVIRDGGHAQEMLDMRTEREANLRTIDALQEGVQPKERRLARELLASNAEAYRLRSLLADMTASQQKGIDVETLSTQQPGTCQGCVQLLTRIKLFETNVMTDREDAELDRERAWCRNRDEDIHRCYGHARQLLAAQKQVADLQHQLAQAKAQKPDLPLDTFAGAGPAARAGADITAALRPEVRADAPGGVVTSDPSDEGTVDGYWSDGGTEGASDGATSAKSSEYAQAADEADTEDRLRVQRSKMRTEEWLQTTSATTTAANLRRFSQGEKADTATGDLRPGPAVGRTDAPAGIDTHGTSAADATGGDWVTGGTDGASGVDDPRGDGTIAAAALAAGGTWAQRNHGDGLEVHRGNTGCPPGLLSILRDAARDYLPNKVDKVFNVRPVWRMNRNCVLLPQQNEDNDHGCREIGKKRAPSGVTRQVWNMLRKTVRAHNGKRVDEFSGRALKPLFRHQGCPSQPCHRDGEHGLSVIIPLTEDYVIYYHPWRRASDYKDAGAAMLAQEAKTETDRIAGPPTRITANPGDVIIFDKRIAHFGGPARRQAGLQRGGVDAAWPSNNSKRPITDVSWHFHLDDPKQVETLLADGGDPVYYVHANEPPRNEELTPYSADNGEDETAREWPTGDDDPGGPDGSGRAASVAAAPSESRGAGLPLAAATLETPAGDSTDDDRARG